MKKLLIVVALIGAGILSGCGNRQLIDTNYTFKKAIIMIGNDKVQVDVASWRDYEKDSQIQVVTTDGKVYLVDSKNITLMDK